MMGNSQSCASPLAHIRDEEILMMPLYRQRATAPIGGAAEIFFGEHEKLRQFTTLFRAELKKLETGVFPVLVVRTIPDTIFIPYHWESWR